MPSSFGVSHGHVVNPMFSTSNQFDVIISNISRMAPLFTSEGGVHWVPCEAVLALGEIKSSFDPSKAYVEKFVQNIQRLKVSFGWPRVPVALRSFGQTGETAERMTFVPLFSFMVFVDSSALDFDDIEQLFQTSTVGGLPNVIYLVDRG